eukprot:9608075-Alexandrium_andersonii.AAC.1
MTAPRAQVLHQRAHHPPRAQNGTCSSAPPEQVHATRCSNHERGFRAPNTAGLRGPRKRRTCHQPRSKHAQGSPCS